MQTATEIACGPRTVGRGPWCKHQGPTHLDRPQTRNTGPVAGVAVQPAKAEVV